MPRACGDIKADIKAAVEKMGEEMEEAAIPTRDLSSAHKVPLITHEHVMEIEQALEQVTPEERTRFEQRLRQNPEKLDNEMEEAVKRCSE